MRRNFFLMLMASLTLFALFACFGTNGGSSENDSGSVRLAFPQLDNSQLAKISASDSWILQLVVAGDLMDTIRLEWPLGELPEDTVLSIPAGSDRKFMGLILDDNGGVSHEGEAMADVVAGDTTHVTLSLKQVKGVASVCIEIEGMASNCMAGLPAADQMLALTSEFSDVRLKTLLTSETILPASPAFVYGSMADGAGLLADEDGGYTFINNIEADYSVARIKMDKYLNPISGTHILNADATANTAQCSGTLITPEEHGFGPLYLSGGEWGGSSKGVFATDPYRDPSEAGTPKMLNAMGQWSVENAVPIGKEAYPGKTVVFIGDDDSDNMTPRGQLGMYVGDQGDLENGKLYGLKVTSEGVQFEMDMEEGVEYDIEFVQLEQTELEALNTEAQDKGVMGFSRLEDIDWRRGSASDQREIYLAVTGRKKADLVGKGTLYGRIYKVTLNEDDPTKAGKISCVLDGDKLDGKAKAFHSPDNILVTENYAYIQEDPNGYPDTPDKDHYARLYQYDLNSGDLKTVLECNQETAAALGYGTTDRTWELTGMIDVSKTTGKANTFLLMTQNHGWEKADGTPFTDPMANSNLAGSRKEGSMLFLVQGLGI